MKSEIIVCGQWNTKTLSIFFLIHLKLSSVGSQQENASEQKNTNNLKRAKKYAISCFKSGELVKLKIHQTFMQHTLSHRAPIQSAHGKVTFEFLFRRNVVAYAEQNVPRKCLNFYSICTANISWYHRFRLCFATTIYYSS